MAQEIIVGGSFEAAHRFAREELGLHRSQYRLAASAMSLKGLPSNVTVHLAPDWMKRYDRFAIQSTLRFARAKIVDHSKSDPEVVETKEPKPRPVKRGARKGA